MDRAESEPNLVVAGESLRSVDVHLESLELEYARLGRLFVLRDAVKGISALVIVMTGADVSDLWPDTTAAAAEMFRAREGLWATENTLHALADVRLAPCVEWLGKARAELDDLPDGGKVLHFRAASIRRRIRRIRRELAWHRDQLRHEARRGYR